MTTARTIEETAQRLADLRKLHDRIRDEITVIEGELQGITNVTRIRRSRFEVPPCGTESAYQRHRWYGEPYDEECTIAHRKHERVASARRRLEKTA